MLAKAAAKLIRYDAMCAAIEAAYSVDEVKDIRDQAIALEIYSRQAHNVEAERQACEIRIRAEKKAGKILAKLEKSPGKRTDLQPPQTAAARGSKADSLHKAGISPRQAKDWEKLARVPDDEFEDAIADRTVKPTTKGIIRAASPPKATPVSTEALWLWGRLKDFESDIINKTPAQVMETMTPRMKDDVHTSAPRVAAWLKQIGATK